ncbi:hypothetical protein [Azohydromonas lata]|uniref:hypothetical protein n=1 Tax=Azohydromonas lata TaxID=45677 RepID=UPI000832B769|nr:hypothetical protein [Azohydromonas lata]
MFSFGEFCMRRVRRTFPELLIILIASYAFDWFSLLQMSRSYSVNNSALHVLMQPGPLPGRGFLVVCAGGFR